MRIVADSYKDIERTHLNSRGLLIQFIDGMISEKNIKINHSDCSAIYYTVTMFSILYLPAELPVKHREANL